MGIKSVLVLLTLSFIGGFSVGYYAMHNSQMGTPKNLPSNKATGVIHSKPKSVQKTTVQAPGIPKKRVISRERAIASIEQEAVKLPKIGMWVAHEAGINEVETYQEIEQYLENVKVDDFFHEVKNSKNVKKEDSMLDNLDGRFSGWVHHKDGTDRKWHMKMDCHFFVEGDKLQVKTKIALEENGREFVGIRHGGNAENFQKMGNQKSKAIIVRASDRHYFQLYYFHQRNVFSGNYYYQKKPGTFLYKGVVHLERL